ncbi:hypothetical protein V1525DRAFT_384667 [Lipomyces kononenkoae]|uniref:Uncharacterized protein n=1 Tax=Lipomyces kononenkoae TaxID=34357 RepID=A0ACC3TCU9_LIPKO
MLFQCNSKVAVVLDRPSNRTGEAITVPILARESLGHKIVAPALFMLGIIILGIIGLIVLRCVGAVMLSVNKALSTSSIKISPKNLSISVQNIPQERYVDIISGRMYSLWMNSSTPGFKSRYWKVRDKRPHQHGRHLHKNPIRKPVHNFWHRSGSESESGSSVDLTQCSEPEDDWKPDTKIKN